MDGQAYPCALGKTGITARKREGDGATPRASMALLGGRFRGDRTAKPFGTESFWRRINPGDGWCDEPFSPAYNRPISLPWRASHEVMTRTDGLYDRLIILDWNISRRGHGRGSAIFLHHARRRGGEWQGTEGCVALDAETFRKLAPRLAQLDAVAVL